MANPAIVIPAYCRPHSLRRLLLSIQDSHLDERPEIIISLEGGASSAVTNEAEYFKSVYSNTKIIIRRERLGLREHILACGDMAYEYGSVILLEDDLMVDPQFYFYAQQAISFYSTDERVAGIALYAPESNDFAGLPFHAMNSGFDAYFMRTPCSWGQAWTAGQWDRFRKWYRTADHDLVRTVKKLPASIRSWPETSWKKYFAAFMSVERLDFVYPYSTLTTNCAESGGAHVEHGSDLYQVSLSAPQRPRRPFHFAEMGHASNVFYDEHMEAASAFIFDWLELSPEEVTIDLYGTKSPSCLAGRERVVTTKWVNQYDFRKRLRFRPVEQNLKFLKEERFDQEGYCVALARPNAIDHGRHCSHAEKLAYFSGLNLDSASNAFAVARRLPSLVLKAAANRIRKPAN